MKATLTGEILSLKETLLEDVTPTTLMETVFRANPALDIRVRRKGREKANPETPVGAMCTETDLWTVLPFAKAAWISTHHVRAVTSAEDVDPRVQEVLDLPTLDLAAEQDEDPDLQFVNGLLDFNGPRCPTSMGRSARRINRS